MFKNINKKNENEKNKNNKNINKKNENEINENEINENEINENEINENEINENKKSLLKMNITMELEEKLSKCTIKDVPEYSLNGIRTLGKVVDVYDGDTCKIIIVNEDKLLRFNCRLKFIDTPEMKPLKNKVNREIEIINAMRCRNKLIQLTTSCEIEIDDKLTKLQIKNLLNTNNKVINIQCHEFDKYGRLLVELYNEDKSINKILVDEGYAKVYDGGTKKIFVY